MQHHIPIGTDVHRVAARGIAVFTGPAVREGFVGGAVAEGVGFEGEVDGVGGVVAGAAEAGDAELGGLEGVRVDGGLLMGRWVGRGVGGLSG